MKKPLFTLLVFFAIIQSICAQEQCFLEGASIVCNGERVTVQFDTDVTFTEIKIDAFTVVGGTQVIALQENKTNNSADIIFLAGGDAEIVIRYLNGNTLVALCNLNVFVFDEDPIPALGMLSNFVDDQVTCGALDITFEMFIVCPECPFYWTLNDEVIELEQLTTSDEILKIIEARLQVEGVGEYTFCHHILNPDSSCFVKDCITIDIIELEVEPAFSLDEEKSIFCVGSSLQFHNETIVDEDVFYIWEVEYDTLQWRYSGENFEFDFLLPGEYLVTLQYYIASDENCISNKTSMIIEITDSPIIPITCSSNSCEDSVFTYQVPIECEEYEWQIDESLGEIISDDTSGVTILWDKVEKYTETRIDLFLGACSEDACNQTFRNIALIPESIVIDGPRGICDKGTEWYEADLIPGAAYLWEIEMIDSVSGTAPQITKIEDNRVRITFNSYVGNLSIRVNASIASKACEVTGEIMTTSLFINTNNNLCPGDLFKATILPNIDQYVTWTLTNDDAGYIKEQTLSGQDDFFAFDLTAAGEYILNVSVPELGFECGNDIPLTILETPAVNLEGPRFICPGEMVTYSLSGLLDNDNVEWTIFQNNMSTEFTGNEISILWEEGGAPYSIKVSRSTEVLAGQFCDSESFVFPITDIAGQPFEISGPDVVCYDGMATYQLDDMSGKFSWEIDPPFMGTIVQGDSTERVTIQWHYAPDIPFATLSTSRELCDSLYESSIDVYFEPYVPGLLVPDTICQFSPGEIELVNLETYETIDIYVDGLLVEQNKTKYFHQFNDTGYIEVFVEVVNPNGCPGTSSVTKFVTVIPTLAVNLIALGELQQCPKDSFEDVTFEVSFQDPIGYYTWTLDGEVIKEGFGEASLYSFIVTRDMILNGAKGFNVDIAYPGFCNGSAGQGLDYDCFEIRCACIEDVIGMVDYLTPLECNLVNFGGSLDFSTVIDPYWRIAMQDTIIEIPILSEEDLIQDSFYFDESASLAQVALRGTCDGLNIINGEVIDTTLCEIFIDELTVPLYNPDFVREYICNEDLTYDIVFTERSLRNSNPPFSSTVSWVINGTEYEGISILVENQEGGTPLTIEMTQCSLDSSYCCTREYETTVRNKFSPNIILPNGSCENDLWLFTLDVNQSAIQSVLWDFGDESGSTLLLTEKGFLDTLAHNISVVVTDNAGCVATAEITVQSFPNELDGEILFESDPCSPSATLTYTEYSESDILNYEWDILDSPDTSAIDVSVSGDYSVTVTDVNGCTFDAMVSDIKVNESFAGGMRFDPENCGQASASVFANSDYSYTWYVDGVLTSSSNQVVLSTPGEYEIKVTSTSNSTEEVCDSLIETLIIYPLPAKPIIMEEKIYCDPFIIELSLANYPSAIWNSNVMLQQDSPSILVSQNGIYQASVSDDNGCTNSASRGIDEEKLPFDQLIDQCIQACREDLDSLMITIPGVDEFATNWTWVTVDTFGIEYEVAASTGFIEPLTITSDMYEYVQLQITQNDGCVLRSERIPLDIEICRQPEPPVEIICEPIDSDHASCGQSIYKCLLSEENGGPKLYFEGSVILPMDAVLCSEDSLTVSLNNGEIVITDLLFEEADGKIMVFYSANIIISDPQDYQENGTVIKFDFCDEDGEIAYCYEYTLPYRTCNKDFECLIDFHDVSAGGNMTVDIDYCLNLSEVIQDNCTLSSYEIKAILSGDLETKTVYTQTLEDDFDNLHCISVPVSFDDFFGGDYQCIELMIEGDCPGIACSEFQCGIFGSSALVINSDRANAEEQSKELDFTYEESTEIEIAAIPSFTIFPNPSTGLFTIELEEKKEGDRVILKSIQGKTIRTIPVEKDGILPLDLSDQNSGVYIATWIRAGEFAFSKKLILIQ